jgi:hypothetical protein
MIDVQTFLLGVMMPLMDGTINQGVADQNNDETLIVQSFAPYLSSP